MVRPPLETRLLKGAKAPVTLSLSPSLSSSPSLFLYLSLSLTAEEVEGVAESVCVLYAFLVQILDN